MVLLNLRCSISFAFAFRRRPRKGFSSHPIAGGNGGVALGAPGPAPVRRTRTVPRLLQAASAQRNMSLTDHLREEFLSRTWVAGNKIQTMVLHWWPQDPGTQAHNTNTTSSCTTS